MGSKSLKSRFIILFILTLASILGIFYILDIVKPSPLRDCTAKWGFINTPNNKYYTSAETIVVEPWRGQHNVYGVFMIPNGYQSEFLFKFTLPEGKTYCGVMHRTHQAVVAGVVVKPGYYLLKGYLNTRIALNLIIKGQYNQLKQSQNWELGYVKKIRNS